MRNRVLSTGKVVLIIGIQLMTAGCITGGAGSIFGFLEGSGFFGGEGDPTTILSSLPSSNDHNEAGWDEEDYAGDGGQSNETEKDNSGVKIDSNGGTDPTSNLLTAATVHNPEPASVVLFAVGLSGVTCLRRRRKAGKA